MLAKIPYGKGFMKGIIPETCDCVEAKSSIDALRAAAGETELVLRAMECPIDSPKLEELVKGKPDCTVIISDHTRPVPSRVILPPMLAALRRGNPDIRVTLLVATGFHRGTTEAELRAKLGDDIFEQETIVVHDAQKEESNVELGVLPSGAHLVIDRVAAEASLLIAEGFIEPHFFAGFSGGRKSVLPGICDKATVLANHSGALVGSPFARTGILDGNPIHEDMLAACKMAGLAYIVNVIIDEDKKVVAAYAGDPVTAHRAGCDLLKQYCQVSPRKADVVITGNGGAPLDQNIYQCVKCMTAGEGAAKEDGIIIVCAECADGTGGESFYRHAAECVSAAVLEQEALATPLEKTLPDQWQYQVLARVLARHQVIFVTREALRETVINMKMTYAASLEEALSIALKQKGEKAQVTVIANGISVIVA